MQGEAEDMRTIASKRRFAVLHDFTFRQLSSPIYLRNRFHCLDYGAAYLLWFDHGHGRAKRQYIGDGILSGFKIYPYQYGAIGLLAEQSHITVQFAAGAGYNPQHQR